MALEDQIYMCSTTNNDCINKDDCFRYTKLKENNKLPNTTLFKMACTEKNNYILYIENQETKTEDEKG